MDRVTGTGERPLLLLVDDDELIVDALGFALGDEFDLLTAGSRQAAVETLRAAPRQPALALVDLGLPPLPHHPDEGFALIGELFAFNPHMKVLVLSGQNERGNIQHALTLGAVDFVAKPCDAELLRARLRHQLMLLEAEGPGRPGDHDDELLAGTSSAMATLRALVEQFADTPFPVLVEGESGSGKELVAQCLHAASGRRDQRMLTLNCAAFRPELLEAQLFGHARGAFTGADKARAGFFEEAAGGTLFLDEVGEMPLDLQAKFLRVLENGEYYRLGETSSRRTDARVVAATNRDLRERVRAGEFRADLFHRLTVLTLNVPPLRSRGDDWRLLLERFQRQYADSIKPFVLAPDAEAQLARYSFPGNVRELRNIVIRLGAKYPGQTVSASQLAAELEFDYAEAAPAMATGGDLALRIRSPGFRLDRELEALERAYIETALALGEGNLSKAARLLGVNRTTLYSRLARLGLGPAADGA
ncbi:MAG: sigma-54-dependent Fis family transcriptional regulator [Gammaproteobacteria bacterium]|nr:sigma-54-dependent Fis family transcriptional regulator [Gammaproteobacteria bacterium]MCP5200417.1 sigma-54-dependent Fis family transcriptional regulator [Gammaproteobacteria bacterium]